MPRKRFTNEQIAFALRQAENGATVDEVCRKMGVSEPTIGGMVSSTVLTLVVIPAVYALVKGRGLPDAEVRQVPAREPAMPLAAE